MIFELCEELNSFLERHILEFLECLLGGNDGVVDILLISDWNIPELLAGSRICSCVSQVSNEYPNDFLSCI